MILCSKQKSAFILVRVVFFWPAAKLHNVRWKSPFWGVQSRFSARIFQRVLMPRYECYVAKNFQIVRSNDACYKMCQCTCSVKLNITFTHTPPLYNSKIDFWFIEINKFNQKFIGNTRHKRFQTNIVCILKHRHYRLLLFFSAAAFETTRKKHLVKCRHLCDRKRYCLRRGHRICTYLKYEH